MQAQPQKNQRWFARKSSNEQVKVIKPEHGSWVRCEIVNFIIFYLSSFIDSRINKCIYEKPSPRCLRITIVRLYMISSPYASHFQVLGKA